MDARYVQRGDAIDYTPTADVAAGDIVLLGGMNGLVGVAKLDIKAGELGALALKGVYEVAKGDTAFAEGALVSWSTATRKAVAHATSGARCIEQAVARADAGDSAVCVLLIQGM